MRAIIAVMAMAGAARAEPPSADVAIASAARFETGPRLCKAMARASRERRDCAGATLPPRLKWQSRVEGAYRVVTVAYAPESIWVVTLLVNERGRVIAESSTYAYGGP